MFVCNGIKRYILWKISFSSASAYTIVIGTLYISWSYSRPATFNVLNPLILSNYSLLCLTTNPTIKNHRRAQLDAQPTNLNTVINWHILWIFIRQSLVCLGVALSRDNRLSWSEQYITGYCDSVALGVCGGLSAGSRNFYAQGNVLFYHAGSVLVLFTIIQTDGSPKYSKVCNNFQAVFAQTTIQ